MVVVLDGFLDLSGGRLGWILDLSIEHLLHWIWYCFDNYFTYFVPVFKYYYSDSRNLWTVMKAGGLAL